MKDVEAHSWAAFREKIWFNSLIFMDSEYISQSLCCNDAKIYTKWLVLLKKTDMKCSVFPIVL